MPKDIDWLEYGGSLPMRTLLACLFTVGNAFCEEAEKTVGRPFACTILRGGVSGLESWGRNGC